MESNILMYIDYWKCLKFLTQQYNTQLKNLLVAGGRGHKDLEKDVKEAIVSLTRWIAMREEETVNRGINNETK